MSDLITIHVQISDVTPKIIKMEEEIKKAMGLGEYFMSRFTTFTRTGIRIMGSVLRLSGTITDVSLLTAILTGVQTQLTIRRLVLRATTEVGKQNYVFAIFLVIQAGLLEMEYAMNLQNQDMMRQHSDRINSIADMNS